MTKSSTRKVVRYLHTQHNPSVLCLEPNCDWAPLTAPDGHQLARLHVRETGHGVRVATVTFSYYAPSG